ncbi:DUF1661 domain-containing protein [Porphyromonas gingivalis]|nr:DUF1661 domain-containing protein [Porphyromonas gingivalis]
MVREQKNSRTKTKFFSRVFSGFPEPLDLTCTEKS